jgi:hypothetical protein
VETNPDGFSKHCSENKKGKLMSREGSIHVNCRSNLDDDPLVSATYGLIKLYKIYNCL